MMQKVCEVMTRGVEVIRPAETLQRAAQRMDELNVGSLPVCEGARLVGMITDRDITVRATAVGLDPNATSVSEVMTEQMRWCTEEQSVDEVMRQMAEVQIRRMPVLNQAQELVGIVSLGDLAVRQNGHIDGALRDISTPSMPDRPNA